MTTTDLRGNPSGCDSAAAHAAFERALWRLMSFYDTPLADLDMAIAEAPGWALPRAVRAGFLTGLTEPGMLPEAQRQLSAAQDLLSGASPRERAHVEAVQALLEGRWQQAVRIWDDLLIDHPRDALALQWAHSWDFYRGDATGLRLRPARVLPAWEEADPLYPHVLALHAFGLEECNLYPQAEETGRRVLMLDGRSPWAIHAVAHVMEMQGRFEAGAAWLRLHQPAWVDNGFATHLWWHKGLFRLEALDTEGVLRLVDMHLSGDNLKVTLHRVDAAALLWRLHLLGQDVRAHATSLVAGWRLPDAHAGHYAFNDVHAVLALLLAGEPARAEAWVARCAERVLNAEEARRSNHAMAREVGLPLMRGLLALARGDADAAVELIYPVRSVAQRFGGSHAQRDLIDQTLLGAAARGQRPALARALLNERRMAKPETPLTRHWMAQLGLAATAG
jgi:hypothetical protein